jgi:hypothetical protein
MGTKTIYIVEGCTGEYEDKVNWQVRAFTDRTEADVLVALAQDKADELCDVYKDRYWEIPTGSNVFDPRMYADYTGVEYRAYELDLEEED